MRVKNTSTRPVDLESGPTLAPGELGDTTDDDPSIEAGLLTELQTEPADVDEPTPLGEPNPPGRPRGREKKDDSE